MPQAFRPGANTISRVTLAGALTAPWLLLWLGTEFNWHAFITREAVYWDQPVPFSHQHHVGQLGIDCRYCHTGVETSAFAGLPPTRTCMTCHSQVWVDSPLLAPVRESWETGRPIPWERVNDLPDFVYFNHSIHVHKGIGCSSCHGRIDRMPLTEKPHQLFMSWCLDCHRSPDRFVRPRSEIYNMAWQPPAAQQAALGGRLVRDYRVERLQTCYTCHR